MCGVAPDEIQVAKTHVYMSAESIQLSNPAGMILTCPTALDLLFLLSPRLAPPRSWSVCVWVVSLLLCSEGTHISPEAAAACLSQEQTEMPCD